MMGVRSSLRWWYTYVLLILVIILFDILEMMVPNPKGDIKCQNFALFTSNKILFQVLCGKKNPSLILPSFLICTYLTHLKFNYSLLTA